MQAIRFQTLFFNMDGKRYGWLCECSWDDPLARYVELSDITENQCFVICGHREWISCKAIAEFGI